MKLSSRDFESVASATLSKLSLVAQICINANYITFSLGFSFPQKVSVGTFRGPRICGEMSYANKKTVQKAQLNIYLIYKI